MKDNFEATELAQHLQEETPFSTELSQKSATNNTGKKSDAEKDFGIGLFIMGCFLIPFSIALLWKNEKKLVTFQKVIGKAKEACVKVPADKILDENEFNLVHVTGESLNETDLVDRDFGVSVSNSYRLVRTAEMYQWEEYTVKEDEREVKKYRTVWSKNHIDSNGFAPGH